MDETYLKMLNALSEEFFKNWKWSIGDFAISLRDNVELAMIVEFDVWRDPAIVHVKFLEKDGYTYLFSLNNLKPIPTQRQLQAMYDTNWRKAHERFCSWYYERGRTFGEDYTCPECMWLKLLMWDKYFKEWNGSDWE